MKLVSWNLQELGGQQKLEAIKRFKFIEKIIILAIQETKMQEAESLAIIKKNGRMDIENILVWKEPLGIY